MRKLYFIFISLIFYSCIQSTDSNNENISKKINYKAIILIDSSDYELIYGIDSSTQYSMHHPLAISMIKDTIELSYGYKNQFNPFFKYDFEFTYKRMNKNNIELYIDTSKTISNNNPTPPDPRYKKKPKSYYSHPLYIRNLSKDTINIGYGDYISVLYEAKDSLGNWKEIEKPFIYMCGTGLNNTILPPDYICITSAHIPKGNYNTKLRIKTINNSPKYEMYSNEFEGSINYTQFVKKNKNSKN